MNMQSRKETLRTLIHDFNGYDPKQFHNKFGANDPYKYEDLAHYARYDLRNRYPAHTPNHNFLNDKAATVGFFIVSRLIGTAAQSFAKHPLSIARGANTADFAQSMKSKESLAVVFWLAKMHVHKSESVEASLKLNTRFAIPDPNHFPFSFQRDYLTIDDKAKQNALQLAEDEGFDATKEQRFANRQCPAIGYVASAVWPGMVDLACNVPRLVEHDFKTTLHTVPN